MKLLRLTLVATAALSLLAANVVVACDGKAKASNASAATSGCGQKAMAEKVSSEGCHGKTAATNASNAKSGCSQKAAAEKASAEGCHGKASATNASNAKSEACAKACAKGAKSADCAKACAKGGAMAAKSGGCAKGEATAAKSACCAKGGATAASTDSCSLKAGRVSLKGTIACNHCDFKKTETCQTVLTTAEGCAYILAAGDNVQALRKEAGHQTKIVKVRGNVDDAGTVSITTYKVVGDATPNVGM